MCQRIADDAAVHWLIAREAARLKREWVVLAGQEENEKTCAARRVLRNESAWLGFYPPQFSNLKAGLINPLRDAIRVRVTKRGRFEHQVVVRRLAVP
jgi:hypothetical protein